MSVIKKATNLLRPTTAKKIIRTVKNDGVKDFAKKSIFYVKSGKSYYAKWREQNCPSENVLLKQKETKFKYNPKISIIVPVYNTPKEFLNEMIQSVLNQTYSYWELCLADGSGEAIEFDDSRIRHNVLKNNSGIAGNTNEALKMATGEYIAFMDHDDTLAPDALFEVVNSLQNFKHDLIYTDEDFVSKDSKSYSNPTFKPD